MRLSPERAMKASSGYVFDIKRFATHDGEGIRTTVFLKGCPLRCAWCQNPEGLHPIPQLLYMESKCMHCGSCAAAANHGGVSMQEGRVKLVREAAENWEGLIDLCPTGALRYDASRYRVADIMREIKKDSAFFRYGGGVTLSGGEPLLQPAFALEILKACKAEGIHTTMESSLFTPQETLRQLLPYLDHVYADLKVFDSAVHKAYTGVENAQILENIRYLLHSREIRDRVTIRTPLIPEMTARRENIAAIAQFLHGCYEAVRYELLNYNPLAKAKYEYLDMEYCFDENPKLYTKEAMESFYRIARDQGIRNLIIE